jgi:hypothetical protein
MDDSTLALVLDAARAELAALVERLVGADAVDLEAAERRLRDGLHAVGARLLEAALAARGAGKVGPRLACPCGGAAIFIGYRGKSVQTLVGWIRLRRAY